MDFGGLIPGGQTNKNLVTWGGDVLTGGNGADKFVFSLLNNDGHFATLGKDTITDFNLTEGDRMHLKVAPGVTLAQINADIGLSNFTHQNVDGNAALDTVITFHDGSSITLLDVNISSFSLANTVIV